MKKLSKRFDTWLLYFSTLTKTGLIFLGLALLLTFISFSKGIQVLMFVPAFILALFSWSWYDVFYLRKKIKIFQEPQRVQIFFPKNIPAYFFKLGIKTSEKIIYNPFLKNSLTCDFPKNTQEIFLSFFGRLDVFRVNIPLDSYCVSTFEKKQKKTQEDIILEIHQYQEGDVLGDIDPVRTAKGNDIFIREKFFLDEEKNRSEMKKMFSLHSNISVFPVKNLFSAFALEWGIIFLGFLGILLEWQNIPFTLFALFSGIFVFFRMRQKKFFPKKWLNPLALLLFLGSIVEGFILGGAVQSGAHFLLSLAIWKHAFTRDMRDSLTYNFLILFVFVALSLYTVSAWFLFLFISFLVLSSLLFSFVAGGEMQKSFSARFGTPYTRTFFWQFLVSIFLLTLLFFILLPHGNATKDTSSLLGQKENPQTGFSSSVSLQDVQSIKQNFSKVIVLERFHEKNIPLLQSAYFRGGRFTSFDGRKWEKVEDDMQKFLPQKKSKNFLEAEIKIYPLSGKTLFFPTIPQKISGISDIMHGKTDFSIFERKKNPSTAFFFTAFLPLSPDGTSFREIPAFLPKNSGKISFGVEKKFEKFFQSLPKNIHSDPQKISNYIQRSFSYSLENPAKDIEDFLYGTQQGHCEFFATTLAVTLQHFGHNATLVNGFHGGEFNPQARAWVVRSQNAHSWVEVEQNGQWKILDPTPSAQFLEKFWFQEIEIAKAFISFYDAIEIRWNRFVLDFTGEKQKEFFLWVFSFWKIYIFLVFSYVLWRISWKNWKKYHDWKKLSEKEKFLVWLWEKTKKFHKNHEKDFSGEKGALFLSKFQKKFPKLVQKTQGKIFGPQKTFSRHELQKKWAKNLKNL